MKRIANKWILVLLLVLLPAGIGFSADATLNMDVKSAYVWRGITFNDSAVFQPSLNVTKGGFGVNVWGNYDFDDYDGKLADKHQFSEIDLTLSYSYSLKFVDLSAGYIEYTFPSTGGPAGREVYGTISNSPVKGLTLTFAAYYELELVEDYYLNFAASYSYDINDKLGVSVGASAGLIGEDYSQGGEAGFNEYNVYLTASYAVYKNIRLSGNIGYTDAIDEDVLPDVDVTGYGGVSLAFDF